MGVFASPSISSKISGKIEAKVTIKSKTFHSSDQKLFGASSNLRIISKTKDKRMKVSARASISIVLEYHRTSDIGGVLEGAPDLGVS